MKQRMNRRDALRLGAYGISAAGLSAAIGPQALALPTTSALPKKKMLFIFLRGGNDGINTVIPYMDPDYNNVALLHRIGHPFLSLSHFTSQQHWETGYPGQAVPGGGVILRENGMISNMFAPGGPLAGSGLRAASVSKDLQRLFNSTVAGGAQAHIPSVEEFSLAGGLIGLPEVMKLRAGLETAFDQPQGGLNKDLVGATGAMMKIAEDATVAAQGYAPDGVYPYPVKGLYDLPDQDFVSAFGKQLKDAIALLKLTPCRVAGVEIGGWDTHSNQGGAQGRHADRLRTLAAGLRAVHEDTRSDDLDLLTMCMSEFGRTSEVNSSGGTDHGKASVMIAMGDSVNQGVYNCDPTTWTVGTQNAGTNEGNLDGDMFSEGAPFGNSPRGRWLSTRTDYRSVLTEAFNKHLGISKTIPGPGQKSEMDQVLFLYDNIKGLLSPELGYLS